MAYGGVGYPDPPVGSTLRVNVESTGPRSVHSGFLRRVGGQPTEVPRDCWRSLFLSPSVLVSSFPLAVPLTMLWRAGSLATFG